ncbi:MAG: DUF4160 domain-containing protein [Thermoanaerobaculia bacterium]|nr:DUF4160 domain-containing protein [Thermoanaerobaculia bacterium]
MPRISQFFGVIIAIYYRDHAPPHFHAIYQENEALISIETLEVVRGSLPRRAMGLVLEWAFAHRDELRLNWEKAQSGAPVEPIEPLE